MEGEDSAGADSGRRRGGTGGGTGGSSVLLWKLTMEDTDDDPEKEMKTLDHKLHYSRLL